MNQKEIHGRKNHQICSMEKNLREELLRGQRRGSQKESGLSIDCSGEDDAEEFRMGFDQDLQTERGFSIDCFGVHAVDFHMDSDRDTDSSEIGGLGKPYDSFSDQRMIDSMASGKPESDYESGRQNSPAG